MPYDWVEDCDNFGSLHNSAYSLILLITVIYFVQTLYTK